MVLVGLMTANALGAETPPDVRSAEAVLAGKGLVRSGKCFLLPKVDEAIQQLGLENMKLEMSKARIGLQVAELEGMNQALEDRRRAALANAGNPMTTGGVTSIGGIPGGFGPPTPPSGGGPPGPGGRGFGSPGGFADGGSTSASSSSPLIQTFLNISNEEMVNRMRADRARLERMDLHERQTVNAYVCSRLLKQYDTVAADPEVKSAIKVLNRVPGAKLAVGPPQAYEHRMVVQAAETLRDKGLKANRGQLTFYPAAEDDVGRAAVEVERARLQLLDSTRGAPPAELATRRRNYVNLVRDLRRRADDAQQRRVALSADPEVREALDDLDRFRRPREKHKLAERKLDDALRRLTLAEKDMVDREVALEPDRDALWVEATLGDSKGLRMVIDPEEPLVRLSSKAAIEAGLKLDDAPSFEVVGHDGRKIPARRARIGSITVGGLVARDVPCILLPESSGNPPSILGASFLDQFVATIDTAAGKLTLVQMNTRPASRAGEPEAKR
jgi:hypothetical protein